MSKLPIPVYHRRGPHACGGIAITVKQQHPFLDARHFPADNVITLDGKSGDAIRGLAPACGSCGYTIDSFAELTYDTPGARSTLDKAADLARAFIRHVRSA